jgi:hypothetical protein
MASIESRLAALEVKHAPQSVIHVCLTREGRFYPTGDLDGPGLSEAEYRAQYGPFDRVIHVGYTEGEVHHGEY